MKSFRFRRQHEQLCTVIVRVLRPTVSRRSQTPSIGGLEEETESKQDSEAITTNDANAIEVNYLKLLC